MCFGCCFESLMIAASIALIPPSCRMASVEKFVWPPVARRESRHETRETRTKSSTRLTSSVPIALHGLWIEGHDDAELLCDAPQDVARHPEIVSGLHAGGWSDLVFCVRQKVRKAPRRTIPTFPHPTVRASLRRLFPRKRHQRRDRRGREPRQCRGRQPSQHQRRSSKVLVGRGSRLLASQVGDRQRLRMCIPAKYHLLAFASHF